MTMTTLMDLVYAGKELRIFGDFLTPLFLASDVCNALGLENVSRALASLDDTEKDNITLSNVVGRNRSQVVVTEFGLYELIAKSTKPEAKKFRQWIWEVMRELRTKGSVSLAPSERENLLETRLSLLEDSLAELRASIIGANAATQASSAMQTEAATPAPVLHGSLPLFNQITQPGSVSMTQDTYNAVQEASAKGLSDSIIVKDVLRMGGTSYQEGKAFLQELRQHFAPQAPSAPALEEKERTIRVSVFGSNVEALEALMVINHLKSSTAAVNMALSRVLPQMLTEAKH